MAPNDTPETDTNNFGATTADTHGLDVQQSAITRPDPTDGILDTLTPAHHAEHHHAEQSPSVVSGEGSPFADDDDGFDTVVSFGSVPDSAPVEPAPVQQSVKPVLENTHVHIPSKEELEQQHVHASSYQAPKEEPKVKEETPIMVPQPDSQEGKEAFVEEVLPGSSDLVNTNKHAKAVQEYPTHQYNPNLTRDEALENAQAIVPMPTDDPAIIRDILLSRPQVMPTMNADTAQFYENMQAGDRVTPGFGIYREAIHDENREYHQVIRTEAGEPLMAYQPQMDHKANLHKKLTGEAAVIRMQTLMGLGGTFTFPLWHSGFWITIKTPTDLQLLDLHEVTVRAKTEVGRNAFGFAFSNDMTYIMEPLMQLLEKCVYSTSLRNDIGEGNLLSRIKLPDFHTVCWGLACAIWPQGFHYQRSIVEPKDPSGASDRLIATLLNVNKLLWVDNSSLSDYQKRHMSTKAKRVMTQESIDTYLSSFKRPMKKRVKIADKVYVTLKVPNVEETITAGTRWINTLKDMVDDAVAASEEGRRAAILRDYSRATVMCQYLHWAEAVTYVDDEGNEETYADDDTLFNMLMTFSSSEEMTDAFIRGVSTFISDTNVSIVAIPSTHEDEENKMPAFPHLVALDAMLTFFYLLAQRAERISP